MKFHSLKLVNFGKSVLLRPNKENYEWCNLAEFSEILQPKEHNQFYDSPRFRPEVSLHLFKNFPNVPNTIDVLPFNIDPLRSLFLIGFFQYLYSVSSILQSTVKNDGVSTTLNKVYIFRFYCMLSFIYSSTSKVTTGTLIPEFKCSSFE